MQIEVWVESTVGVYIEGVINSLSKKLKDAKSKNRKKAHDPELGSAAGSAARSSAGSSAGSVSTSSKRSKPKRWFSSFGPKKAKNT